MAIIRVNDNGPNRRLRPIADPGPSLAALGRQAGQSMISVGKQMSAAGQAYFQEANQAEAEQQYNRAITEGTLNFNKAYQERLTQTKDKDGNPTYASLVDDVGNFGNKAMQEIAAKITNPAARAKFETNFSRFIGNKQIQAFGKARTQQIDFGRATLFDSIEIQGNQALQDDPANLNHYRSAISEQMDSALQAGLISDSEHRRMKKSTIQNLNRSVFNNFIKGSPQQAFDTLTQATSDQLGISEESRLLLARNAEKAIKAQAREQKRVEREMKQAERDGQNRLFDQFNLDIVEGKAVEQDIRAAHSEGRISTRHLSGLLGKLKSKEKTTTKKMDSLKKIDASLEAGTVITASPKQVSEHYEHSVAGLVQSGQERPTLAQKATIASKYAAPVKAFQKELEFSVKMDDNSVNAQALQAYRYAETNGTMVLDGLDRETHAVLETAKSFTQNTNLSDEEAIRQAKKIVLDQTKEDKSDLRKAYRRVDDFKPKNISETVRDMYDISSGFFGFGGSAVPAGITRQVENLLEDAFVLTGGDAERAKSLVKSWTKNVLGTSEINGKSEFMLLPPEKAFPGISVEEMRKQLSADLAEAKPGMLADNVKLQADELSRVDPKRITYQLTEEVTDENGVTFEKLVLDDRGEPLRWSPDKGVKPVVDHSAKLEQARTERQQQFEVQEQFKHRRPVLGLTPISDRLQGRTKQVVKTIEEAANEAGIDGGVAAAIAKVESGLRPNAKAPTSSASGLFQFINSTWKEMVKRYGKKLGIKLEDKNDPVANSKMGALFIRDNIRSLERSLGRKPDIREVYLAHFSGAGKAIRVIKALERNPDAPVGSIYSQREIRANRGILKGTLRESFNRLTNKVVKAQQQLVG